tara:strand:+ start:550 stop:717 length:168 start_codon:yes stop_codon:yes gene_type:complete
MSQQSDKVTASVTWLSPEQNVDIKDPPDTLPSDKQPPGVDEDWEPQSLEEALLGE